MNLSLRSRIFLTLAPLLVLLAVLGSAAPGCCTTSAGASMSSCKENYASVVAMQQLNEAVERIDSSFQFALAGEEERHWPSTGKMAGLPPRTRQGEE